MSKKRSPGEGGGSVASPRSGSSGVAGLGQQQLVQRPVAGAAALQLDPGLLVDALHRRLAHALDPRDDRQRQVAEALERGDAARRTGRGAGGR